MNIKMGKRIRLTAFFEATKLSNLEFNGFFGNRDLALLKR